MPVRRLRPAALVLATVLLGTVGHAAAEEPAAPTPFPMGSPFGPGYDPTRPAPREPETAGAGIVAATVVAAGAADVEERRSLKDAAALFGVVLDIEIEAGSTTPMLDASSIVASVPAAAGEPAGEPVREAGKESGKESETLPVHALCLPTADESLSAFYRPGATTASWNVAIGDRRWLCGGRTARMALVVGSGGLKLSAGTSKWKGPLVLLFETGGRAPTALTIAGRRIELSPAAGTGGSDDAAN